VTPQAPNVLLGDLDERLAAAYLGAGRIAWDIETTSLDWREGSIATCQLAAPDHVTVIRIVEGQFPERLKALLENATVTKVFHHAPFDLRYMTHHWHAAASNVACTKVVSKILDPLLPRNAHSLRPVLRRYLGVEIDKSQQTSDWSQELTDAQIEYAMTDVAHLLSLLDVLLARAESEGVKPLVDASYQYLPTRARLDVLGVEDVFRY
jgi:ribonuclease D